MQFTGIVVLGITGPTLPYGLAGSLLIWGGILLGVWALWTMRKSKVRALPAVAEGATLIKVGPYAIVRNPMYLAVLMATLGWVIETPTLPRWLVWCGILATLIAKLLFEEQLLRERFSEYDAYRGETKRLVPWVW